MNFTNWIQAHRRSILFLLALLAAGGLAASFGMPVTLFPRVNFPRIDVGLDAGDRPAEQMVLQVTRPVEEAVRRVPGVRDVRSTTSRGSAEVSVTMQWGTDMSLATLQVNSAISQIMPSLPQGTSLLTRRMDPTVFPIIAYSLTSSDLSLARLHDLAAYELRPLLSSVDNVARIGVTGGDEQEFRVTVDPGRLTAYGLSLQDVARALSVANVLQAVGRMEDHYKLFLVLSDTRFKDLADIRRTVLTSGSNGLVRLEDVATVESSTVPRWIRVTADGRPAVLLQVYQQPGGNSVRIARDVKAKLKAYAPQLPKGVKIANWYDQSRLVVASAASVRDAILIGIGLAALVLLAFLRSLKITLIAVLVVPTVLAATVVLLSALGMSFNIMTLGGMAAAVGLIIDDAIVMNEHIVRRLRGREQGHRESVMRAAREFFPPLAGSSAATIVIFVPLAFLGGLTGSFFKALSLTMASSLFISFLVSWLAIPLLAGRLLREKDAARPEGGRLTDRVNERYAAWLRRLLDRPWLALVLVAALLAGGLLAFAHLGSGFMPSMDEGGFILDYRTPPGTALSETDRLLRQVEEIVSATPEVETYSRRTGTGLGGGLSEANEGDFFIRLKNRRQRDIWAIMDDVRGRIERRVPGIEVETAQLMEDLIGDLTAVPQPVEVKLFYDTPGPLESTARQVAARLRRVPGIVGVRDGINPAGDALDIRVDKTRAALEGLDPEAVTALVRDALSGTVTTQVQEPVKMVGVRVWIPEAMRGTEPDISKLLLRAPDGHLFPLGRIAKVTAVTGQPQISRENLKRMVAVTGRISGRDLGSVMGDVKKAMGAQKLPRGMYYELGGTYAQQQIAFAGLRNVFAAAVGLVFLLLLYLYESFRVAAAIMVIPLLAVAAVFAGLWAAGIELNISAIMGMTMIIGIVTEVAIFYFSEYHDLLPQLGHREAAVQAGVNRFRPIAMTTLAAILTLLPLAFALGQGSAMQQPLAVAIISGLVVQLPLVLLIMPVLFDRLSGGAGAAPRAGSEPPPGKGKREEGDLQGDDRDP
ncbi:acriflavin resistance protein [Desulfovibrio sp. X2]|uniref:efflux RND transporter permease subunit n=1 Tax=Desulfovibrio sp. X2 TaxID=941449 RepID=UPI00035884A7|nr:efflux RND transporter permease subunit [Desulfovibrio sp. X2]EPR43086.1 acriflavin resistance protein [Desulfovibrio sp. X2]